MRPLLAIFILSTTTTLCAAGQQIGQNKTPGAPDTYRLSVKSQLVVETVVAKDGQGKFIDKLAAKDFAVTEDGVPQTIRFCEHQNLTDATPVAVAPPGSEEIKLYKTLTRTQITPEIA